jgi:predicted Zn-dependent protease
MENSAENPLRKVDEAYQLRGGWLKFAPSDVVLLVKYGILAQQFGHADEAALRRQKALTLDPSQADADLHLPIVLEKQGEPEDAIVHDESFLTKGRSGLHPTYRPRPP